MVEEEANKMKDPHPLACRARMVEETLLGSVVLDTLSEYKSTFEKKHAITYDNRNFSTMRLQKNIPKFDERTKLENYTEEQIKEALGEDATKKMINKYKYGTYIHCDLRYFNLASLGKFQVVYLDPPWRMGTGQRVNEKSHVVSNSNFTLHYNTMSNQEIMDMDVGSLSDEGFIFLWVLNSTMQFGFELIKRWGYKYVDKITWVKRTKKNALAMAHGYFILHSTETCLIGLKSKYKSKFQYISRVTNDVIFAKTGIQSQKPDIMYHIIEKMVPGVRKIELFAKNHNIHGGWLSLGNMLGPMYDAKLNYNHICHECHKKIKRGMGRMKHRHQRINYCKECFELLDLPVTNFFYLENMAKDVIFHDYYTCDCCNQYPIIGPRFTCDCGKADICEYCYDTHFILEEEEQLHVEENGMDGMEADEEFKDFLGMLHAIPDIDEDNEKPLEGDDFLRFHRHHEWSLREVPRIGDGFPVHMRVRCDGCLTIPIIGERFRCNDCRVNFCRKCFFAMKTPKNHVATHHMSLIPEARINLESLQCFSCHASPLVTSRRHAPLYRCNTCLDIILCQVCYHHRHTLKCFDAYQSHKPFHEFSRL